jgi:hypothetical protein
MPASSSNSPAVLLGSTCHRFVAFPAASSSLAPGASLSPGTPILLKSLQTVKYCQVVLVAGKQQIICNLTNPSTASAMQYTGSGVSYQGQGFVNPYSITGGPLQLSPQGVPATLEPGAWRAGPVAAMCLPYSSCRAVW